MLDTLMGWVTAATLGLFGLVIALRAMWRWHGGWRLAALLPALLVIGDYLLIMIQTTRAPTSHNLWPLEIIYINAVSAAMIGGLSFLRRFLGLSGTDR